MSLTTRSLRLHLLSVLNAPLAGAKVTLQLSAYQADGPDIVPLVWALPEDGAVPGDYVGPIWPNNRGSGGTHYDLLVQANGQVLLAQAVTVLEGTGGAEIRAKITAAPYPPVYAAEKAVSSANTFADASGESASRALAAVNSINAVVEDYGTASAAAVQARQSELAAIDKAGVATAQAVQAGIARAGAEAARDMALIQGGVYATEAAGRAAVADGVAFKVQGSGDVAAYEYRRINSATSALITDYPSASGVIANKWLTQTLQARQHRPNRFLGEVFNGAQFWNGAAAGTIADGGIKIPAGSSGTNSYVRYQFAFTAEETANLVGRVVRFFVPLSTSPNFSSAAFYTNIVQKDGIPVTPLAVGFQQLSDDRWVYYWDWQFAGDEGVVESFFQRGGGVLANDFHWWPRGMYFLAQDEKGFGEAVTSYMTGAFSDIQGLEREREFGMFADERPKISCPRHFTGEVFRGAKFWNGTTTVGATQTDGGILIPPGTRGLDSYVRMYWDLSYSDRDRYKGRPIRFAALLKTTEDAFVDKIQGLSMVIGDQVVGVPGVASNRKLTVLSSTRALLTMDYLPSGQEAQVQVYLQASGFNGTGPAQDWGFWAEGLFMLPLDLDAFGDIIAHYSGDLGDSFLEEKEDVHNLATVGEALLGGTIFPPVNTVVVPAGQTGFQTYLIFQMPLHQERLSAGQVVTLELLLENSANFFTDGAPQFDVAGRFNGVFASGLSVPATVLVQSMSPTVTRVTADYVLRGGETEYVGIFVMVGSTAAKTNELRYAAVSAKYKIKSLSRNQSAFHRDAVDNAVNASGDLASFTIQFGEAYGGAVLQDSMWGVRIPAGQHGQVSYSAYRFPVKHIAKFVGAQIRVILLMRTSPNFLAETQMAGRLNVYGTLGQYDARAVNGRSLNSTLYEIEFTYVLKGDEVEIRPYWQVDAPYGRASEGFFTFAGMRLVFDSVGGQPGTRGALGYSLADQALTFREGLLVKDDADAEYRYIKTVNVKPDGTGDYLNLKDAAIAEGGGTSPKNLVLYKVYEGVQEFINSFLPNYIHVFGIGQLPQIHIRGYQPPSTPLGDIEANQTMYWNGTGRFRNLTITGQNLRYPIHSDSGASAMRSRQEIEDCYVEHIGNEEARAYQASIGGNPGAVWSSEHAWGCGTHSGQVIHSKRTKWKSRTSPFYFHTNKDFAEPCEVLIEEGAIICTTAGGNAIWLQALGSGTADTLTLRGVHVEGRLRMDPNPVLSVTPSNYRGNMNTEIAVHASGCSPFAWSTVNVSNVLCLQSIDAAGSDVAVSGSAAKVLFGAVPDKQYGGAGYAARIYSAHAISCANNFAGISLAARLGNRSTDPLVLNIVFDGAISKALTLNQNFTGKTNAEVITILNGLLADGTRSFSEVQPYDGIARIFQVDREKELQNSTGVVILKGEIVAYDGSRRLCRKATSTDPREVLAGIALQNIAPGRFGRVQHNGQLSPQQLSFDGVPAVSFGDLFGATPLGKVSEGVGTPLLRCIEAGNSAVMEIV